MDADTKSILKLMATLLGDLTKQAGRSMELGIDSKYVADIRQQARRMSETHQRIVEAIDKSQPSADHQIQDQGQAS